MANNNERQTTDVGYINLTYNRATKTWAIGGNFTDEKNEEWDLGYAKVGTQCLADAINLIAKQLGPTLNGKGIKRERRQGQGNSANNNSNNNSNSGGGGY